MPKNAVRPDAALHGEKPAMPGDQPQGAPVKPKKKRLYKRKGQSVLKAQLTGQVSPPPVPPPRTLNLDPAVLETEGVDGSEKKIIEGLFSKAFERYTKRKEANRGIEAIADVVSHIQSGASMKDMEEKLTPLLSEQSSKTTILQAVMFNHMMELVALHWDMRWHLMRELWEDLREQKLKPVEKLALLKLADQQAERAANYINNQNPTFQPMTEVDSTMERASKQAVDTAKRRNSKELEGTTPQGREIVRRLTFKAKQAADKIVESALAKPTEAKPPENSK
jgi:hypothetical protein